MTSMLFLYACLSNTIFVVSNVRANGELMTYFIGSCATELCDASACVLPILHKGASKNLMSKSLLADFKKDSSDGQIIDSHIFLFCQASQRFIIEQACRINQTWSVCIILR